MSSQVYNFVSALTFATASKQFLYDTTALASLPMAEKGAIAHSLDKQTPRVSILSPALDPIHSVLPDTAHPLTPSCRWLQLSPHPRACTTVYSGTSPSHQASKIQSPISAIIRLQRTRVGP